MRRLFWLRRELRRLYREKGIKNKARGGLVFLQQETIFGAQGQKLVICLLEHSMTKLGNLKTSLK
jgi:hypothetical protein